MSDDDSYGPALPPGLVRKKVPSPPSPASRPVGPALPSNIAPARPPVGPSIGPSLPGPSRPPRSPSPVGPSIGPSRPGPTVGPSLPTVGPTVGPSRPAVGPTVGPSRPPPASPAFDDDSDDEIGPQLSDLSSTAPAKSAADAFREREERMARARVEAEQAAKNRKPQRDEWMTIGPPQGGSLANIDPLKRPTQFNKRSHEAAPVDQGWLESPAEKARREADERAGIKHRPKGEKEEDEGERKRRRERDEAMREQIDRHSSSTRGASLLEQHQKKKAKTKDDEAPVIWDRETMMGVGGLMSEKDRVKKIQDAAALNDRFGHSKSGAYM